MLVSEPSNEQEDILSAFDLGPAWAREETSSQSGEKSARQQRQPREPRERRDYQQKGDRPPRDDRRDRGKKNFTRGKGKGSPKGRPDPRDLPKPTPGVKVRLSPSEAAIHLISKEIQHRARVYSLLEIAKLFLSARDRYRLEIEREPSHPPLFRGLHDNSLFDTKEEAAAHFMRSPAADELYETEEIECEPPKGNFQVVAKCGLSGEWLGPPNFHNYQTNLRRLHRERFANMPFERYVAKVRTERGEEAVNAWLESMTKRIRWRLKGGGDDDWTFDRAEIERDFLHKQFSNAFKEVHQTTLPGDFPATHVSEGIMAAVRIAGSHTRHHPAMMIPTICKLLTSDHLSIFKRQGKLFCGPARPHPLSDVSVLADRPAAMVTWLQAHPDTKLAELWQAVLPEDATEPPREWLADLFWLLTQGHVLLFSNDRLVLPVRNSPSQKSGQESDSKTPKAKKRRRKKPKKPRIYPAKFPSHGDEARKISRLNPTALKKLRGRQRLTARRLERRDKIESLLDD